MTGRTRCCCGARRAIAEPEEGDRALIRSRVASPRARVSSAGGGGGVFAMGLFGDLPTAKDSGSTGDSSEKDVKSDGTVSWSGAGSKLRAPPRKPATMLRRDAQGAGGGAAALLRSSRATGSRPPPAPHGPDQDDRGRRALRRPRQSVEDSRRKRPLPTRGVRLARTWRLVRSLATGNSYEERSAPATSTRGGGARVAPQAHASDPRGTAALRAQQAKETRRAGAPRRPC